MNQVWIDPRREKMVMRPHPSVQNSNLIQTRGFYYHPNQKIVPHLNLTVQTYEFYWHL
jgi:hypothetical protein